MAVLCGKANVCGSGCVCTISSALEHAVKRYWGALHDSSDLTSRQAFWCVCLSQAFVPGILDICRWNDYSLVKVPYKYAGSSSSPAEPRDASWPSSVATNSHF